MKYNRIAQLATVVLTGGLITACAADPVSAPMRVLDVQAAFDHTLPPDGSSSTCPGTGTGTPAWSKIDHGTGSASGAWGSFSYTGGPTFTYTVNAGYTLQVCLKSSTDVDYTEIVGAASGSLTTMGSHAISHMAWRIVATPPTIVLENLQVEKTAAATYTRNHRWTLTKLVNGASDASFSGAPGDAFNVTWQVNATKTTTELNYLVTGNITITNPNPVSVPVSVTDQLFAGVTPVASVVTIDCNGATAGTPSTGNVPANGSLVCSYTTSPSDRTADVNRADVTVGAYTPPAGATGTILGSFDTAPVSWQATVTGDNSVTLGDARFDHSQVITVTTPVNFPETFTCSRNIADYLATGSYVIDETNSATLTGANTNLTASARVLITCAVQWADETATGRGAAWSDFTKTRNWFMFTAFTASKVDLVAGQHYDAGDIYMTRATTTSITITLHSGFRFADVSNNVKILPMLSCTPNAYVSPGAYTVKRTASGSSITVSGLANTACYAIHVDVQRLVWP